MDEHSKPGKPGPREDRWQIAGAEITLAQTRLYHNGRQQVRIRLWVQPMRGNDIVSLTPTERANIRLVDYDRPGGVLPFDDGDYRGWSAQHEYRGYSDFPETRELAPRQGPGDTLFFYVSANDLAAAANPLRLSFSIKGDDGSVWRTTGHVDYPNGDRDYFSHLDLRENISVTAVPPVLYSVDNFHLDRRSLGEIRSFPAAQVPVFNDMLTLSIVGPGGRIVAIRDMTCVPAGMIHWINEMPFTSNPCFTGYVRPGQTAIQWNPQVPTGWQPLPQLPAPEPGRGVFLLCGRIDIPRGDHIDPPRGPITVEVIDEYGTQQRRGLGFVIGKRDELAIR